MKKQIEVKVEVVSDKPIFYYHLLEISKSINTLEGFFFISRIFKYISNRVTANGLFVTVEYDNEDYYSRRLIQRFKQICFYYDEDIEKRFKLIDDDKVKITDPGQWFKTINSSGMVSEYYVVEYENKKYLFLDHLCGNREIFNIEEDNKVYKDFLNIRIPCDFKTDIYKKYLKDKDVTISEWTVKEFKNNKMNYNFTVRMY